MTINPVRVREYKARRFAKTGLEMALPSEYARDAGINPGDMMAVYRDAQYPGILIIAKAGSRVR
jgi:hypothetical protein